uniref:Uncharacterized protein n=1 Tax=Strombidium inclinatum TaxID=197538 RepID=A0A7S3IDF9_9SPIT|mmetsp:Transcript_11096/g.16882  ORF Transcript_11096/g.16882 Transcript_11096/m.16882 type:complete len:121 (+) Transcript_11096:582-944(+)
MAKSSFLPYINNEKHHPKAEQYKARFSGLNGLMMVMFGNDTVVTPRESEWFQDWYGEYVLPYNQSELYVEDWIGLRTLEEAEKVHRLFIPDAGHLHYNQTVAEDIFVPFLYGSPDHEFLE